MLMTCRHVRQLNDAYVDGELSPSLMAEVHAHLLQCPECQREVEMLRVCGDVIAKDQPEPMLDSGFASRVVAALPKTATASAMSRRNRRRRWGRLLIGGGLPAAAAVLFFGVLLWPQAETDVRPTFVAGASKAVDASGVKGVVDSTLDAVADTQRAARSLNQLLQISVDSAREDMQGELGKVEQEGVQDKAEVSFLDLFLQPFDEMLTPVQPAAPQAAGDEPIERF